MRSLAALLVVFLAVGSVAGVGASHSAVGQAAPPSAISESPSGPSAANETTVSDTTEMHVSLRANGDARWNVTQRYVLHDENETEAFRDLAESFADGSANVGLTRATFERVVGRVDASSDRRMELHSVDRTTAVRDDGSVGVLSLSFTWTNFTSVPEDRIELGDSFWVGSGTWLPTLSEDQTLVIAAPEDYYISGGSPSGGTISNGIVLRYEGPQKFDRGDFSVTYAPRESVGPTWFPSVSKTWGLLVVVLLFGGGFGAYALSQRRNADPVAESDDGTPGSSPTVPAGDEAGNDAPRPTDERSGAEGSGPGDSGAGDSGESADAGSVGENTSDDGPATELLSDEERVLRLLRDNDGRMKQSQIVRETNWSNAKVSQLLSEMNDNDDVDKLRIGRENLITLPDEDVADAE